MIVIRKNPEKSDEKSSVFDCIWRSEQQVGITLPNTDRIMNEEDCLNYLIQIDKEIADLRESKVNLN